MPAYVEAFRVGEVVRVVPIAELEKFERSWRLHHPLSADQLEHASTVTRVLEVSYYHGGDPLYELEDVPGMWQEQCLEDPTLDESPPPPLCTGYVVRSEQQKRISSFEIQMVKSVVTKNNHRRPVIWKHSARFSERAARPGLLIGLP